MYGYFDIMNLYSLKDFDETGVYVWYFRAWSIFLGDITERVESSFFLKFLKSLKLKWFIIIRMKIIFNLPHGKGDMALCYPYYHLTKADWQ